MLLDQTVIKIKDLYDADHVVFDHNGEKKLNEDHELSSLRKEIVVGVVVWLEVTINFLSCDEVEHKLDKV